MKKEKASHNTRYCVTSLENILMQMFAEIPTSVGFALTLETLDMLLVDA